ncbi:MAG: GNAT family N-acetyltransferase [Anaeroplasmataceae bacterium]|nr:GNAT family N-acetyltransferase [Anaeroplasmataceae bacterium]
MIRLRDMIESDIEDYVYWFTKDTEWMQWDAPWEEEEVASEVEERQAWTEYYRYTQGLKETDPRYRLEIEYDGKHIGWVCAYQDLGYLENKEKLLAIGIDIPAVLDRGHGVGTLALQLFIDYLKEKGHRALFVQTWSGNHRMLKVIKKLGFQEFYREQNYRIVSGESFDAVTYKINI